LDPYPALLQRQFAAMAQLRALETGRWLVSAANTGPSLLINPRAQVIAALPVGAAGTGQFTVPLVQALTPYDRFGDAPLLLLALGAAVLRWRWRL
jgi:apolipoprotein N-acyltransferase